MLNQALEHHDVFINMVLSQDRLMNGNKLEE